MTIDWDLLAKVAAPTIAVFVGAVVNRAIERRARLISYLSHASAFTLRRDPDHPFQIHTHSIVVRNAGRKPAQNVRLGHYVLPDFQVWPAVEYRVVDLSDGGKEILIPSLVPGEQITVSYLYMPPLLFSQVNSHTKSDEGFARIITVLPTPQWPRWAQIVAWALLLMGLIATLYLVFAAVRRIVA